jgi:hypothetical protein
MITIKKVIKNHHTFENNIESIIRYGLEIISDLPYRKPVPPEEKEMLLESLLLRACALWESFIEKEIILLINIDPGQLRKKFDLPLKGDLNIKIIRAIIFSDSFRDFHDLDRSMSFFEEVISDKFNTFKTIKKEQNNKIIFTFKIRNYLAHYSEFSKLKLYNAYQRQPYGYRRFLEPGKFLLKQKGKNFENLLNNFNTVSIQMRTIFR